MNLKPVALAAASLMFASSASANQSDRLGSDSYKSVNHYPDEHRVANRKAQVKHTRRMWHEMLISHDNVTLLDAHGNTIRVDPLNSKQRKGSNQGR
ncbi:hypothetical protein FCJ61_11480 [Burkholderia metallica]|uniref:hypothetical protein n=1 Tax=Burkholderia metallica TaxID=488729 RepID=UPI00157AAEEE|nr:hypothetical protein [Burkholderia metallica]NTZ83605.1 hypothetical protein [Burkholderia metallica]